jgi:predicted ABC-type ATPase
MPPGAQGEQPIALLLAGPNGAGKTTASAGLVPTGVTFLNADIIAARLLGEGHQPAGLEVAAGREVLAEMHEMVRRSRPFCLETNLAGRGLVRSIALWHEANYHVQLIFVALDSPDLAVTRVATRVRAGGHDVPEAVIRRRWQAGLRSFFEIYLELVDGWVLIDNSQGETVVVATGLPFSEPQMRDLGRWGRLRGLSAAS